MEKLKWLEIMGRSEKEEKYVPRMFSREVFEDLHDSLAESKSPLALRARCMRLTRERLPPP